MPNPRRAWGVVFLGALTFATWAALRPAPGAVWFAGQDKVQHLAAFAFLYLAGRHAFGHAGWRLPVWLLAYGVGIELLQSLRPDRTPSRADVVADALGLALGALLVTVAQRRWPKPVRVERGGG